MSNKKATVLFVCVHNAGRSQMAAGYLQHLAAIACRCFQLALNPKTR